MGHLVIGLGGVGFKALCMLKAALQASNPAGVLPAGVALRAVDTENPDIAIRNRLSEIIGYGGTPLDGNEEYIWLGDNDPPIGANLAPVVHALQRGGWPRGVGGDIQRVPVNHITSWFQATTLMNVSDAGNWNVSIGASQQRQIARLALFWNVQSPSVSSFHRKVTTGIQQALVGNDPYVVLVGSTAGGTGAGLLLDVAYLVRALAPAGVPCTVTAFFLLPGAFSGVFGPNDQALKNAMARTYAFQREIERFSIGVQRSTCGHRVIYNPYSPLPQYRGDSGARQRLLDAVYYLDGVNHLRDIAPEDGVIPLVTDVAQALLSETGISRQNHMLNMVTIGMSGPQKDANLVELGFYGTVGSYSIILPMARIVDSLSWRLVTKAAQLLAEPGEQAEMLSPYHPGGAAGRSELTSFCDVKPITGRHRNPTTQVEENFAAGSTDLLQDIYTLGVACSDGSSAAADRVAWEFAHRSPRLWGLRLLLRATHNADRANAALASELGKNFVTDNPGEHVMVPTTLMGEDNRAAWRRVREKVAQELVSILGTEQTTETFNGGTLQGVLNGVKADLLQILRQRLRLITLNILNGQTPAGGQADLIRQHRGNSLGYLYDFLLELRKLLVAYQEGIRAGLARRARRGSQADHIYVAYDDVCREGDRHPAPGLLGVRAESLRRRLLNGAQALLDLRRTEQIESMLLEVLGAFASDVATLQEGILQFRDGTRAWGEMFTVGGDASIVSVAEGERLRAEQAGQGHGSPVREVIWDTDYNESLYSLYGGGGAAGVIGALDWWLSQPDGHSNDRFGLQLWMGSTRLQDASSVAQCLVSQARRIFAPLWHQEGLLKYLAERGAHTRWSPTAMVSRLQAGSQLALAAGFAGTESTYLVAPVATNAFESAYRTEILATWGGVSPNSMRVELVGDDRFRVTLIRWRDLINVSNLSSLVAAKQDYLDYWSKYRFADPGLPTRLTRETLHVFPGEVEAVGIETLLPLAGSSVVDPGYELHPAVVYLLDEVGLVQGFLHAWAWEVISEQTPEVDSRLIRTFVLELPEEISGPVMARPAREYWLSAPERRRSPSFFNALTNWACDGRDYHPGPTDSKGRVRPTAETALTKLWAEVGILSAQARSRCLAEVVAATPNWHVGLTEKQLDILSTLPPEQARTASLLWAQATHLSTRLSELRGLEGGAQHRVEQDTIRVLMILLWRTVNEAQHALECMLSTKESTI